MAMPWLVVAVGLLLVAICSLVWAHHNGLVMNGQGEKARAKKGAYAPVKAVEGASHGFDTPHGVVADPALRISQLWVYPIKSLRGCSVPRAMLTKEGFQLDRWFMLVKDHGEVPRKLENMAISTFPSMCLFHTSITGSKLSVQYRTPGNSEVQADELEISLEPDDQSTLEQVKINMHSSQTTGYDMGERYNSWFSSRFGFKVILVFWGGRPRAVLGNRPGKPSDQGPKSDNVFTKIARSLPVIRAWTEEGETIAFNDCAPYLVISESSVADVTSRLPHDVNMDVSKFRANIVLRGHVFAYDEDYWGELSLGKSEAKIALTGNCGRCTSLNVDYLSGESGTGRDGNVLRLLQRDRRVDAGYKYSPIFGRYGFVNRRGEGSFLNIGDEVVISQRNEERTRFFWPGIST